jgi:hypothetical protein
VWLVRGSYASDANRIGISDFAKGLRLANIILLTNGGNEIITAQPPPRLLPARWVTYETAKALPSSQENEHQGFGRRCAWDEHAGIRIQHTKAEQQHLANAIYLAFFISNIYPLPHAFFPHQRVV